MNDLKLLLDGMAIIIVLLLVPILLLLQIARDVRKIRESARARLNLDSGLVQADSGGTGAV
jgi:inner membrane protein involved in colicin E2 resistance